MAEYLVPVVLVLDSQMSWQNESSAPYMVFYSALWLPAFHMKKELDYLKCALYCMFYLLVLF